MNVSPDPEDAKRRVRTPLPCQQLCPTHTPKSRETSAVSWACSLPGQACQAAVQAGLYKPLALLTHSSCFSLPSAFSTSARGHHLTIRKIKQ